MVVAREYSKYRVVTTNRYKAPRNLFVHDNLKTLKKYSSCTKPVGLASREYFNGSDSQPGTHCFVPYTVVQTNQLLSLSQKKYEN